jgi:hypothetical protein
MAEGAVEHDYSLLGECAPYGGAKDGLVHVKAEKRART